MGALAVLLVLRPSLVKFWPATHASVAFIYHIRPPSWRFLIFVFFSTLSTGFILLSTTPTFFSYPSTSSCILWERYLGIQGLFHYLPFFPYFHLNQPQSFLLANCLYTTIDIISVNCIYKKRPRPQGTSSPR